MGKGILNPPPHEWPHGKLFLTAQQDNIANITWTLVDLDNVMGGVPPDFNDGIEDTVTHRITPGVPGFYHVEAQAVFRNIVVDKKYEVAVYKNGAGNVVKSNQQSSLDDFLYVNCSDIILLDAIDYLDLRVYHNAGVGTIDVSSGTGSDTRLTVQRVR